MNRRLIQAVACLLAGAALSLWLHRPGETPTPPPVSVVSTPAPLPLMPGAHAEAAATTGDWYAGWEFRRKSVCIESGIYGAPLAAVAAMYRVYGIAVYVRFSYGQCAAAGFGPDQRVVFSYYTAEDKAGSMGGACAYTRAANYGYLTSVYVRVNVLGGAYGKQTACGGDPEWTDLFGHELGHAFGFTHKQPYVSSIMRDGHSTNSTDDAYLGRIYSDNSR